MLRIQAVGFILDVSGNLSELVSVSAGVVRAKEEVSHGHDNTNVGLGAATVAPVSCGQRGSVVSCWSFSHVLIKPLWPHKWAVFGSGSPLA